MVLDPFQIGSKQRVRNDAFGIEYFTARPQFIRHIFYRLCRVYRDAQQGGNFLKWFGQGRTDRDGDEDIDRGISFAHFVVRVSSAARTTKPSKDQVNVINPDCATGYRKMEANAMIRNAVVWRLNLFLSITHHSPKKLANPVKRLVNMTNRPV